MSWKGPGDQLFETPMQSKASFQLDPLRIQPSTSPVLITAGNLKSFHEVFKVRPVIKQSIGEHSCAPVFIALCL